MTYFDKLNYTLSNEDTRVEVELLQSGARKVFAIAGSGARVLPLLAKNPNELVVVDVSVHQLYLAELRIAAAKKLTHPEFIYFLGYRGGLAEGNRQNLDRSEFFDILKDSLSADCRQFWDENRPAWCPRGIIYLGKWEGHFIQIAAIFRKILFMNVLPIFEAHSMQEQLELYRKHWKSARFKSFLRVAASEWVFEKFLYKGHFAGARSRKTVKQPAWEFLHDEFVRIFTTTLVRKNYMMQLFFLGKVLFEEGLPIEATASTLDEIKRSNTRVRFLKSDLTSALASEPFDFVSLSDTISYLPAEQANQALQMMASDCSPGTTVVIRSFLRAPTAIDTRGWTEDRSAEDRAYQLDGTGVYRFHIFRKN